MCSGGSVPALGLLSCQQFLLWFTAQFWLSGMDGGGSPAHAGTSPDGLGFFFQSGTCHFSNSKEMLILKALKANACFK